MYVIDEEEYRRLVLPSLPYSIDDMPANAKEVYLLMYSLYSKFLTEFIIKHSRLRTIDNEIRLQHDFMKPVESAEKDSYQLFAEDLLQYFYVRNNLYLHRLSRDETSVLSKKLQNDDWSYDDIVDKLIAKTYKKVIAEKSSSKNAFVNFGPIHDKFFAPPSNLIIGFRCAEAHDVQQYRSQLRIVSELQKKVAEDLSGELKHSVSIIHYDKMSVKKKS